MDIKTPKTYDSVAAIDEGGCYEVIDGRIVRVEEPTAPAVPKAEAGPEAAVGAASGEPPARAEVKASSKPAKAG